MANVTIITEQVSIAAVEDLRRTYCAQLRHPQEPLLETLVPAASAHLIHTRRGLVGYGLVHPEKGLFEYHLDESEWAFGTEIFGKFIQRLAIAQALVKSFDDVFMAAALDHQVAVQTVGMLVRHYFPRQLPETSKIRFRPRLATAEDLPAVFALEQDVFTHRERLQVAVERGWLWLYCPLDSAKLIGFGLIKPVHAGDDAVDIGIAIDRAFRNKGYALYVLRDLMERSIALGFRPIAGVSMDNLPSRRMGQRIGLSPIYRLLKMTFAAPRDASSTASDP